jgi:inner membrane protein
MIAGLGVAACFHRPETPPSLLALGAFCGALPDIDVIGFRFGARRGSLLGHRGLTHSILLAVSFAAVLAAFLHGPLGLTPVQMWLFVFLATISHSLLDALTNGGPGVAFFAPFENRRFFFPFRPIEVCNFGLRWLFTPRGAIVLASECLWVWLPTAALAGTAMLLR